MHVVKIGMLYLTNDDTFSACQRDARRFETFSDARTMRDTLIATMRPVKLRKRATADNV